MTANTADRAGHGLLRFISSLPKGFYAEAPLDMPGKRGEDRYIFPPPGHTGREKKPYQEG